MSFIVVSFNIPSYTLVDLYLFIVLIVELLIVSYLKKHRPNVRLIQPAQKHETCTQTDMILPIDPQPELTQDVLLISSSTDSSSISMKNRKVDIGINTEEETTDPIQPKEVNEKIEELKHENNEKSNISVEKPLPWRRIEESQHRDEPTNLPWRSPTRAYKFFEDGNENIEKVPIPNPDDLLSWRNIVESTHKIVPTNFPRGELTRANNVFDEVKEKSEKAPIPTPVEPILWKTIVESGHKNAPTNFHRSGLTRVDKVFEKVNEKNKKAPVPTPDVPLSWKTVVESAHKNVPTNFPRCGLTRANNVFEEVKEKSEKSRIPTFDEPFLWKTTIESRTKNVATSFTGSGLTRFKDSVTKLIVSVDARPHLISGYCMNRYTNNCKFYTFPSKLLPWKLDNDNDSNEFEMKNLMFALLLWEDEITFYKKVRIYTDNGAINAQDCVFGLAVTRFLDHLAGCKDVIRINSNIHVNKRRDENPFNKYIKPADDLSRWNIKEFQKSISESYGNTSYMGTHEIFKVKNAVEKWTTPCESCGFYFPRKT